MVPSGCDAGWCTSSTLGPGPEASELASVQAGHLAILWSPSAPPAFTFELDEEQVLQNQWRLPLTALLPCARCFQSANSWALANPCGLGSQAQRG